jgi:hypothetical protein
MLLITPALESHGGTQHMHVALLNTEPTAPAADLYGPRSKEHGVAVVAERIALHIDSLVPRGRAHCIDIGYGDTALAEAIHERLARTNWRCVDVRPAPSLRDRVGNGSRASDDDADTIPFGDGEFDVAVLNGVIHDTPEQAARLLAEAARVARYVLVKDRFERESYSRTMLRLTREAFIRLANQQRLVIAAFDSGLALEERLPGTRALVQPEPNFLALLCRG